MCLRREYSRYDVTRTFERALAPMAPPTITIPGLAPIDSGGFVSHRLPETAFARWGEPPRVPWRLIGRFTPNLDPLAFPMTPKYWPKVAKQ